MPVLVLLFIALLSCPLTAQQKPTLEAVRTDASIKIDGILDEAAWADAPAATDFTTLRPTPGLAASQPTAIKVLYDNKGIYLAAQLFDSQPDSILAELTERDDLGNTDFFGFVLDPYQSGIDGFTFLVTPSNVQFDAKQNDGREDENWDAVWVSETQRNDDGWVAEIFLPYSALRFPSTAEQRWTVNFVRMIRRANEQSFWAEIDPTIDGFLNQSGTLTGLYDIKAPLRLQATPFVAVYGLQGRESNEKTTYGTSITGGMDVKLGLSDAFTLDMTLIPDFGEARSDDQILNLGPFEQRFDEQRAFFTEGTELFNKGGLFYSRRVGGRNFYQHRVYDQLGEGEEIVHNPQRAKLYNATKISGRTAQGTGLGFFNAVEQENYATIRNTEGEEREVLTNPLTNYNVVTVDQNLPNNSSATLINTNVLREGEARDANVTGLLFDIHNNANAYAVRGGFNHSRKYEPDNLITGHALELELARISGQWTWEASYGEESDTYDVNDLGIIFANNSRFWSAELNYNRPQAFFNGKFLNGGGGIDLDYRRLYAPSRYVGTNLEAYVYATTKGFWNLNLWTEHDIGDQFDFFEPRVKGRYWRGPGYSNFGGWIGTDGRKKLRLSTNFNLNRWWDDTDRHSLSFAFNARYRFSDRLSLSGFAWRGNFYRDVGYVNRETIPANGSSRTDIYFGTRNRSSVEAGLSGKYSFSARMTLNLRLRHYWSGVAYSRFHLLDTDGRLVDTDYQSNHDQDFDALNVDLIYRWRFAPGSDIFVVYKSNITDFDSEKADSYSDSFSQLWGRDTPRSGSLSVKVVYWLDYASLFPG
ncbi:hypothetical protein GGR26_002223 [Lewinella marina]|uniref:DUF5916 domain-containing protein n=1 Tax=Neolewinella marina TaxID=438751 RepID=A0A2G0CGH5_9BACT|nr:DUF5916 domain-containing protein [Neolewinella marina]NJB86455.1 hypothetical protein [Neolewinella marina]PHK99085.1 hypothetical protein CGL56_06385 [Neolewinella marina]